MIFKGSLQHLKSLFLINWGKLICCRAEAFKGTIPSELYAENSLGKTNFKKARTGLFGETLKASAFISALAQIQIYIELFLYKRAVNFAYNFIVQSRTLMSQFI